MVVILIICFKTKQRNIATYLYGDSFVVNEDQSPSIIVEPRRWWNTEGINERIKDVHLNVVIGK